MKKLLSIILTCVFALGLLGCSYNTGENTTLEELKESLKTEVKEELSKETVAEEDRTKQLEEKLEAEKKKLEEKIKAENKKLEESLKAENKKKTEDYNAKLNKNWASQYFYDTDKLGRPKFNVEPNFVEEANNLPFPIKYQFHLNENDPTIGASIKICFKFFGNSKELQAQKDKVWDLIYRFNQRNPLHPLLSVYYFNLDNTANEEFNWSHASSTYVKK